MYRNLRLVPQLIFGRGSIHQLGDILTKQRTESGCPVVFLIDAVHEKSPFVHQLPLRANDLITFVDVGTEPKTQYVDELTERVKAFSNRQPDAIVGIGGGSAMDLAKSVSLMLTNPGSAADYQGWDLVKYPAIFHVGIPTLAGSGAEVSRTAVLTGPVKKLGINSDFTPFDQIVMDPDLIASVPPNQRFYTAMDCYIHSCESLQGTFINEFSRAFAESARDICRDVFLRDCNGVIADERLMVASYFGGLSIAYSQVGVCHALSYGLSYVLGVRHGVGNCIVFNQLEEYYGGDVREFKCMIDRNRIDLPTGVTRGVGEADMNKMIDTALGLDPLWKNALGDNWKQIITRDKIRSLYVKM
jgi:3-deoxy-alpha-D-manno-octulosonate 8-oxidase